MKRIILPILLMLGVYIGGLNAQSPCTDPNEPNETLAAATNIGVVTTSYNGGALCISANDHDWYAMVINGATYYAHVRGYAATTTGAYTLNITVDTLTGAFTVSTAAYNGSNVDTYLELYNAGNVMVGSNDDANGTFFSSFTYNPNAVSFAVSPTSVTAQATGGSYTFVVTATPNVSWTVTNGASANAWSTMSTTSGAGNGTIVVTAQPNTSTTPRLDTLYITGNNTTYSATLYQLGVTPPPVLTVSPMTLSAPAAGGTYNVVVSNSTGINWSASASAAWVTGSPMSSSATTQTIAVVVAPNTATTTRSAYLTVAGGGTSINVSVNQAGVAPPPCNDHFEPNNAMASATPLGQITSTWSDTTLCLSVNDYDWFSFTDPSNTAYYVKVRGFSTGTTGNYALSISAINGGLLIATNSVGGSTTDTYLHLYDANGIQLAQDDDAGPALFSLINYNALAPTPFINTFPSYISAPATGGTYSVSVSSNVSWTVSNPNSWMHVSAASGTNNALLSVIVDTLPSSVSRTASFTINGGGVTHYVTVGQAGATPLCTDPLEPNNTMATASTLPAITGSWSNSSLCLSPGDNDWFGVNINGADYYILCRGFSSPVQGAYSLSINVTSATSFSVATNSVGGSTTDTYLYLYNASGVQLASDDDSGPGFFSLINYNTANTILNITPSVQTMTAAGGSFTVNVTSNTTWTATNNQGWCSVTPGSGTNSGSFTVFVSTNGGSARTGTVTVSGGGSSVTLTIYQAGSSNYILASPNYITWPSAASTATVNINSNVSWTATSVPTWVTMSQTSGTNSTSFTISCAANTNSTNLSGVIILTGGGTSCSILVNQSGYFPPVANDDACNATTLIADTICNYVASTTAGATADPTIAYPTCFPTPNADVWFTFTVPANGSFTIRTQAGTMTDPVMAIYSGNSCSGPLLELSCNDDYDGLLPRIIGTNFTAGQQIWVRVYGFGSQVGSFGICVEQGAFYQRPSAVTCKGGGCVYELQNPVAASAKSGNAIMNVYPNPATTGSVQVDFTTDQATSGRISIADANGRILLQQNAEAVSGSNTYHFDVTNLPSGIYFVRLETNGQVLTQRLTVTK